MPHSLRDLSSPDQGSNPCPLQWKHRVLTTGPPGKSRKSPVGSSLLLFPLVLVPVRNFPEMSGDISSSVSI